MRQFQGINTYLAKVIGAFLMVSVLASSFPSEAATPPQAPLPGMTPGATLPAISALPAGAPVQTLVPPMASDFTRGAFGSSSGKSSSGADLGDPNDPDSAKFKSDHLAKKAVSDRKAIENVFDENPEGEPPPPPEMDTLQQVNRALGGKFSMTDDPVMKEISLDMRRDAQKEAALSYGARGGLSKRNYEITERMKGFDVVLDKVFDFRSLLIQAPSGLLIEPPIVKESIDALVIDKKGEEAAVANEIYDINKQAKIVAAPRDWRQYLVQVWSSEVPPPPRILWPKNAEEQDRWDNWVEEGWVAGTEQAEQIFEMNVNRMAADYGGMVRYRMLLSQGMISKPYALHEDRGVTGGKNQMRVGDRALRITGPSQFLTGANLWKPADR